MEKSTGTSPTPPKTTAPVQQVPKIERGKAETPVQKPAAGAQTMSAQTPENSGYTTTNEQIWGEGGSGLAGHDQYVEQTKQKLEQDKTAVTPISEAKYENWLKQLGIDPSQYEPGKVVETENGQVHQEGAQRPKTEGTSGADEDLLSGTGYGLIQAFKAEWDRLNELAKEAEAAGNRELAAQYRQQRDLQNTYANQIRAGAGYYGGTDGSMYIPLGQLGAAQGQQSGTVQGQSGTQQGAQSGEGTAMQLRELLSAWQEAAQQQANGQIDYATQQAIRELERALEDAQPQFKEQAESVAIDERQAMDNAALYAQLRGDNGGIGQEQYNSIQNTAAQNRLAVQQAERFFQLSLRFHHAACSLDIQRARRRELDRGFAAYKDGVAQLCFDLAHSLGECGLGDGQGLGSGGEAALADDGKDHAGVTSVHGKYSLYRG